MKRTNLKAQTGVAMLEFAIILPTILIIVAGLVDYGMGIRSVQNLTSAARHGSRFGASKSYTEKGAPTQECGGIIKSKPCKSGVSAPADTASVAEHAYWGACNYLDQSGELIDPDAWEVEVDVPTTLVSDGVSPVMVTVKRNPNSSRYCFICLDELTASLGGDGEPGFITSTSVFLTGHACKSGAEG